MMIVVHGSSAVQRMSQKCTLLLSPVLFTKHWPEKMMSDMPKIDELQLSFF